MSTYIESSVLGRGIAWERTRGSQREQIVLERPMSTFKVIIEKINGVLQAIRSSFESPIAVPVTHCVAYPADC